MDFLYFLLGGATDGCSVIFKKLHKKPCSVFFSGVACFYIFILYLILNPILTGNLFVYNSAIWPYAVIYGLVYALSAYASTVAFKCGPVGITSLLVTLGGLIPVLYNVIFLGEAVDLMFFLGIIFFVICLVLLNIDFSKKDKAKTKKKINVKWIIFAILASLSYGMSMVMQGIYKNDFTVATGLCLYENEFMMLGALVATVFLVGISLFIERKNILDGIGQTIGCAGGLGVLSGFYTISYLLLLGSSTVVHATIAPILLTISLLTCVIIGVVLFKEKYKLLQFVGMACGIAAVVFLSL